MHSDMSDMIGPDRKEKMKSTMKWPVVLPSAPGRRSIWGNSFFIKDGPGKFHEASDALGAENYCPWGPSVGDLNADGYDDTFIASGMNYPYRYMINSVKLNDRGVKFVDAEFLLGVEPRKGGVATPYFELDAAGKDKAHTDAEGAIGRVAIWGARGTRSSAIFDLDGDGDLDIVTNDFNASPMVLVSNLSREDAGALPRGEADRHDVESRRAGRGGQGHRRRIDLHEGHGRQLRVSLAQPVSAVLRARRTAEAVDSIEVAWPSGKKQTVQAPKINSVVEVREQ